MLAATDRFARVCAAGGWRGHDSGTDIRIEILVSSSDMADSHPRRLRSTRWR